MDLIDFFIPNSKSHNRLIFLDLSAGIIRKFTGRFGREIQPSSSSSPCPELLHMSVNI